MIRASEQAAPEAFNPSFLSSSHIPAIQQPSQGALSQSTMTPMPQPDPFADVRIAQNETGKGVLIGMLSAFGSAAIVALILLVIYFFQYTQRGRILLDRLARPGEFDDEQAFLREEADALELMDDMERMEYLRAKGTPSSPSKDSSVVCGSKLDANLTNSFRPSKSTGIRANRYITFTVPRNTRKRSVGVGIRTGTRNRKLFCRGSDRDRIL